MSVYPGALSILKSVAGGKTLLRAAFNQSLKQLPVLQGSIADIGGTRTPRSSYLDILRFDAASQLTLINIDPNAGADIVADAIDLPLQDASQTAVLCFNVLEHVADPRKAMREIGRILKPGCSAYIETPFLVRVHGHPQDYHRFTDTALRDMADQAGLVVSSMKPLLGGPFVAAAAQCQLAVPRLLFVPLAALAVLCDALVARVRPQYMSSWPLGYLMLCQKPHVISS